MPHMQTVFFAPPGPPANAIKKVFDHLLEPRVKTAFMDPEIWKDQPARERVIMDTLTGLGSHDANLIVCLFAHQFHVYTDTLSLLACCLGNSTTSRLAIHFWINAPADEWGLSGQNLPKPGPSSIPEAVTFKPLLLSHNAMDLLKKARSFETRETLPNPLKHSEVKMSFAGVCHKLFHFAEHYLDYNYGQGEPKAIGDTKEIDPPRNDQKRTEDETLKKEIINIMERLNSFVPLPEQRTELKELIRLLGKVVGFIDGLVSSNVSHLALCDIYQLIGHKFMLALQASPGHAEYLQELCKSYNNGLSEKRASE